MQIENIKLTKEELNEAVQKFLDFRNIKVKVTNVETYGYPTKGWSIDLDCEKEPISPQPPSRHIQTPEDLGKAIEQGEPL